MKEPERTDISTSLLYQMLNRPCRLTPADISSEKTTGRLRVSIRVGSNSRSLHRLLARHGQRLGEVGLQRWLILESSTPPIWIHRSLDLERSLRELAPLRWLYLWEILTYYELEEQRRCMDSELTTECCYRACEKQTRW